MRAYFTKRELDGLVKMGQGFRPLQSVRKVLPALRPLELCWQCDRPTYGFIARRRDALDLHEAACSTHIMAALVLPEQWVIYGRNNAKRSIDWYTRWYYATKNNPFGYKLNAITPIGYEAVKDSLKDSFIPYLQLQYQLGKQYLDRLVAIRRSWDRNGPDAA